MKRRRRLSRRGARQAVVRERRVERAGGALHDIDEPGPDLESDPDAAHMRKRPVGAAGERV